MNKVFWNLCVGLLAAAGLVIMLSELVWGVPDEAVYRPLAGWLIHLVLMADAVARWVTAKERGVYARKRLYEWLILLPLPFYLSGHETGPAFMLARQAALVTVLLARLNPLLRKRGFWAMNPAKPLFSSFLLVIVLGSMLLMLPEATRSGVRLSWVDALFTSTSAVCVTGLTVLDTAGHFSRAGQLIILTLIQLGGLGIMTAAVSLVLFMRKNIDMRRQAAMQDMLDHDTLQGARRLTRNIILMTVSLELVGAVALAMTWRPSLANWGDALYHATFHAISAFCNAGFSTFSDNLMSFRDDVATNVIIALLILGGGLGFVVITDLEDNIRQRLWKGRGRSAFRLRVQSRIVLTTTLVLTVVTALLFYAMEPGPSPVRWPVKTRLLVSLFQAVSAATAGFNTCDIGLLGPATLAVLIVRMFIGASPGGTGGGIKTTTAAILWATVIGRLRGRARVEMFHRTIPVDVILKAVSVLCMSLFIVVALGCALMYIEHQDPMAIAFETVSAFGTVGLSTGVTVRLTVAGRLLVSMLMLIGRLGPLTMAYVLVTRRSSAKYEYAEERVMIG